MYAAAGQSPQTYLWVGRIPDLSTMEPLWDYMKRQKESRRPAATEDLRLVLHDVENNLVGKILHKLSASKN